MEGAGAVASVIAIIELSAKIGTACVQYSCAVKDAAKDIGRFQEEIKSLREVLEQAKQLLSGPSSARLLVSKAMNEGIEDCESHLQALDQRLTPSKTRKAISRMSIRALKWPFETAEVDKVIRRLERCKQSISLALQVDQTHLTLALHQKIDLAKLPSAEGAAFDSHTDELNARCHPDTRIELQSEVKQWADGPRGKCIFWLCGIAGTGKSTISRTAAQLFADEDRLAASFFFKRGSGDRGNASRFFSTIARQLIVRMLALSPFVSEAIEADHNLTEKSMKEQFEKLILQPLSKAPSPPLGSTLVMVIDALDECEREEDIKAILRLMSQVPNIPSVSLRIFVTSRPELPVRLGFKIMSGGVYQDFILHEIPRPTIEHDIAAFFRDEFANIRANHNILHPDRPLPSSWPGSKNIKVLVNMAIPLFIFAATVCRFVADERWDPQEQLQIVLKYDTASQASNLDRTYQPILDRLLLDLTTARKEVLIEQFKLVVGSIILLADPLSRVALASLLNIPESAVNCRLDSLHSILSVPTDRCAPVRLLHLSFREFLVDPEKQGKNPFWVHEKMTHEVLATKCLELMSRSLKENICDLKSPGTVRAMIDSQTINDNLPADVQYACQHWVYHLEQGGNHITDQGSVDIFLSKHFLHWLEALSLIGRLHGSIPMLAALRTLIEPNCSIQLADLLLDAKRFILKNQMVIDNTPIQIYSSALVFSPKASIVRNLFQDKVPFWISGLPNVESTWNAELQTLEGHADYVTAVAFSHDGKLLASASRDSTARLWDPDTGTTVQILDGHTSSVTAVAFSHDAKLLASASYDKAVRLWDPATGTTVQILKGHTSSVTAVVFSHDAKLLASASDDNTVRLWDPTTGMMVQTLKGHTGWVRAVAFSYESKLLASASDDKTVKLWDPTTGTTVQTVEGHTDSVTAVAFSHDGKLLASASKDNTVRLWDPTTGTSVQTLKGHTSDVTLVAFSHNGKLLASASRDNTVRLWDPTKGTSVQIFNETAIPQSLQFSADGKYLETDRGSLRVQQPIKGISITQSDIPRHSILLADQWVSINGKRVLWLPPEYRSGVAGVHNNVLALGLPHGPVVFVSFTIVGSAPWVLKRHWTL